MSIIVCPRCKQSFDVAPEDIYDFDVSGCRDFFCPMPPDDPMECGDASYCHDPDMGDRT